MLTITSEAADAIRFVLDAAELPQHGGMRISTGTIANNGHGPTLQLQVVEEPAPEDQVLSGEGAQVFLDPAAAAHLEDKTLDADYQPGGEVRFSLLEHP